MAKHSNKRIHFNFIDFALAEEFLKLIQRKKMYADITGKMNRSGKLELTLTGSPENIKIAIQKAKKLHASLISERDSELLVDDLEDKNIDLKFKLKKLKFEES